MPEGKATDSSRELRRDLRSLRCNIWVATIANLFFFALSLLVKRGNCWFQSFPNEVSVVDVCLENFRLRRPGWNLLRFTRKKWRNFDNDFEDNSVWQLFEIEINVLISLMYSFISTRRSSTTNFVVYRNFMVLEMDQIIWKISCLKNEWLSTRNFFP